MLRPVKVPSMPAELVVRKPNLDFDQPLSRFYLDGNPIKTHIFNALNLLFPEGERFFVKSVHDHGREITNPQLLRDMRAFAGQEGQHAYQHERFFVAMKRQGYQIDRFLAHFHRLAMRAKSLPRALRLSITAGAEHYTATLAAALLEFDLLDDCDPVMRDLIMWHAVEEIEHKHVAYDTLVQAYPRGYPLRVLGFLIASLTIFGYTSFAFRFLMRQDKRAGRVSAEQLARGRVAMRSDKELRVRRELRAVLVRYFVPGFHPSEQDDSELLARFRPLVSKVA
jgi:predicted metal-dependent hydrolase